MKHERDPLIYSKNCCVHKIYFRFSFHCLHSLGDIVLSYVIICLQSSLKIMEKKLI